MNSLQSVMASLNTSWQKLTAGQKTITVIVPLLVLSSLLYYVWWSGRPNYTPLFQGPVAATEAGDVITKLKELKIPYQISDGGATILVPKAKVAEVRIDLASAGIPQSSKFSFANLNSSMNFGETDADRKLRYTLGLQDELETTLKTLAPIDAARVHLALPEKSLFVDQAKETTAAVTIKLKPGGKLTDEQILGIANLLSSSIEGLKPDKVTIIDTSGKLLSKTADSSIGGNLSGTQLQMQQSVQENLELSAQSMLDKALGEGRSVVRVISTLDFDQVQVKTETYANGVVASRQNSEETTTTKNTGSSSVPGTSTNVPSNQTPAGSSSASESKSAQTNETFAVGKTEETRVISPGSIKKLSVSVLLDAQSVDDEKVSIVKGIVTSAVGLSPERGDQMEVAAIPFKTETPNTNYLDDEQRAMYEKAQLQQVQQQQYLKYGVAGGLALLLILLVLIGARSGKKAARKQLLRETLQPAPAAAALEPAVRAPAPVRPPSPEEELFKHKVNSANQAEPDDVAKVIKLWLQDEVR